MNHKNGQTDGRTNGRGNHAIIRQTDMRRIAVCAWLHRPRLTWFSHTQQQQQQQQQQKQTSRPLFPIVVLLLFILGIEKCCRKKERKKGEDQFHGGMISSAVCSFFYCRTSSCRVVLFEGHDTTAAQQPCAFLDLVFFFVVVFFFFLSILVLRACVWWMESWCRSLCCAYSCIHSSSGHSPTSRSLGVTTAAAQVTHTHTIILVARTVAFFLSVPSSLHQLMMDSTTFARSISITHINTKNANGKMQFNWQWWEKVESQQQNPVTRQLSSAQLSSRKQTSNTIDPLFLFFSVSVSVFVSTLWVCTHLLVPLSFWSRRGELSWVEKVRTGGVCIDCSSSSSSRQKKDDVRRQASSLAASRNWLTDRRQRLCIAAVYTLLIITNIILTRDLYGFHLSAAAARPTDRPTDGRTKGERRKRANRKRRLGHFYYFGRCLTKQRKVARLYTRRTLREREREVRMCVCV